MYAALQAVALKRHGPEGYKLTPAEALDIPSEDETAFRWPGMSPDEIVAVDHDHERDRMLLHDLNLEGIYESMEQLVDHDVAQS